MTPLPSLPPNLNPNSVPSSLSNVTARVTERFPNLPTIPNFVSSPSIPNVPESFSVANTTVLNIIEQALPENELDKLIEQYRLPNGTVNISDVELEIENKYETLNDGYNKIINASEIPPLAVSEIIARLIPEIPVPNIPSPLEIQQYINNFIEKKKQEQQQAIMKAQRLAAQAEELPFTARNAEENNI